MVIKLKRALFAFYLWYNNKSPIKKGNAFLGRKISRLAPIPYIINNVVLNLNPSAYIDQSLIYNKEHDDEVKKLIDELLTQDDIFLDIGANIGYFSLYAAATKRCAVLAFEPSKREYYRFYKNIEINNLSNIVIYPYALGKENTSGSLNLATFLNPGENSLLSTQGFKSNEQEIVLIKKLSDVVVKTQIQKVRLVKIDVEGYEVNVLEGMQDCMEFLVNAKFVVEITTTEHLNEQKNNAKLIYQFFKNNGFSPLLGLVENRQYNELFSYQKAN